MKLFTKLRLLAAGLLLSATGAHAVGWPANYEGVMLQGFYWDSYSETSWSKLTAQADELSKYFKLIWVPNSAKAEGQPSMGYHPIYWFTNHNSSFGSEAQLREMINTYKAKGTGFIADVVINHRSGVSNWTNFPEEKWNGKTYKIGPEGICNGDEVRNASGQATPTGAADTGENWDGSRDLDHTNANVQANCKDYIKCLLTDYGYEGVRYDFVKGYAPQYTKMYNQANNVKYSVGEYWDGSYDAVKSWIEGTGRESAAFDFPFKYQLNKAFNGGAHNYAELVWMANSTTAQPAGMIHYGYSQLAVTFVDNHDTYRDGSKFTGDVLLANAFMLSSPGTPCVFYPHYKQYKQQIQAMIDARNGVGIHNCSPVTVLEHNGACYVAEVTGTKGKLFIKMGNSSRTPGSGYTKKASGNGYEIWTTAEGGQHGGGGGDISTTPETLYVIGEVDGNTWAADKGTKLTKQGDVFYGDITLTGTENGYFSFAVKLASSATAWGELNVIGNRYAPSSDTQLTLNVASPLSPAPDDAKAWYCTNGEYAVLVDFAKNTVTLAPKGTRPENGGGDTGDSPAHLYLIGDLPGHNWEANYGVEMTKSGDVFTATNVELTTAYENDYGYFSFASQLGSTPTDWDGDGTSGGLNGGNRYGSTGSAAVPPAPGVDIEIAAGQTLDIVEFKAGVNASACASWKILPGKYNITADLANMKITVRNASDAVEGIDADNFSGEPEYYNLQGVRVAEPTQGIYIVRRGSKVTKEVIH